MNSKAMWKRVLPPSVPVWDRKGVIQLWKETKPPFRRWDKKGKQRWKALERLYLNLLDEKADNKRLAEDNAAWVRKVKGRFAEAARLRAEDEAEKAAEAAWRRELLHQGIKAAEEEKEKEPARELWLRRGVVRRSTTTDWFEEEFGHRMHPEQARIMHGPVCVWLP